MTALSIIIPASNEGPWIGACLGAVFASDPVPGGAEVIVVANGCRDDTAAAARAVPVPPGWTCRVLDLAEGSKPGALDAGDAVAQSAARAYLDADCVVSPAVFAQIAAALNRPAPVYVGATPVIPRAASAITRAYGRFWQRLPFNRAVAPGYGLYAVNGPGRARWGGFPRLISDDTFVRLQFTPDERVQVPAPYDWPMVEGWAALVKVRRRQDAGLRELQDHHPGLFAHEGKARLGKGQLLALALRDPLGFATYAAVSLAVRRSRGGPGFTRGR